MGVGAYLLLISNQFLFNMINRFRYGCKWRISNPLWNFWMIFNCFFFLVSKLPKLEGLNLFQTSSKIFLISFLIAARARKFKQEQWIAYQGSIIAILHNILTEGEYVAKLLAHAVLQVFRLSLGHLTAGEVKYLLRKKFEDVHIILAQRFTSLTGTWK